MTNATAGNVQNPIKMIIRDSGIPFLESPKDNAKTTITLITAIATILLIEPAGFAVFKMAIYRLQIFQQAHPTCTSYPARHVNSPARDPESLPCIE